MRRLFSSVVLCLLISASCGNQTHSIPTTVRAIPTLRPTSVATSSPLAADEPQDSGWLAGSAGSELRTLHTQIDDRRVPLSIVRLDLAQVRLRVGYAPTAPRSFDQWINDLQPLAMINGGFFDESFTTSALLVSDGQSSGSSYQGFGGMLAVAADGAITIQPLRDQPYDTQQALDQALQSFPMLVFPGGTAPGVEWDADRSHRSAVALDRSGRLLLIACPQSAFTLNEFASWLRTSDLDIERALNLDGGGSTALYNAATHERIEPFSRLPIVLYATTK